MAFGIDDFLMTAAAGIRLTDTVVSVIENHKKRKKKEDLDIELMLEQVRIEAAERIDVADKALLQFVDLLKEKKISFEWDVDTAIRKTPFWNFVEKQRLKAVRRNLVSMTESVYDAADDIAALLKCKDRTEMFGEPLVAGLARKHAFQEKVHAASNIGETIRIMRDELADQKKRLLG